MKRRLPALPGRQTPPANVDIAKASFSPATAPVRAPSFKDAARGPLADGFFVVSSCGRISFMGSEAKRCLARFFPAAADSHHLPPLLAAWTGAHGPQPHCWESRGRRLLVWQVDASRKHSGCYCVHETSAALAELSDEEILILYWVGVGKTNEVIALLVGIGFGTVKKRLEHMYQILGVENRVALSFYAREFVPHLPD